MRLLVILDGVVTEELNLSVTEPSFLVIVEFTVSKGLVAMFDRVLSFEAKQAVVSKGIVA